MQLKKNKKVLIIFLLILFLFSAFRVVEALTSESLLQITNVEILNKSDTADIVDVNFSKNEVKPKVVYHQTGDFITYKLTIKNCQNKNYTIKSIKDNNTNEYFSYEYESYEGVKVNAQDEFSISIKETYIKSITDILKRNQEFSVGFIIVLQDEDNNVIDQQINFNDFVGPSTGGQKIGFYLISLVLSFLMLLFLSVRIKSYSKNNSILKYIKKEAVVLLSLFLLIFLNVFPVVSDGVESTYFNFSFNNSISLKDKLIVSFDIDGTLNDIIVDYNECVDLPTIPQKDGYNFDKWILEDGTVFDENNPIKEDITIKAKFIPIEYYITYELNGGSVAIPNPTEYNIETDTFTLNNPTKEGYDFVGWTGSNGEVPQKEVTIPKGSTGNKEYTANWELTSYSINYELDGGSVAVLNPTEYNIETETFTLNNPTKEGYDFVGWTGSNGTEPQKEVTIPKGSTDNKEYTANWELTSYSITYELNGGSVAVLNPTQYSIETETFTLNNPTKEGYKFTGWTGSNGSVPQKEVTIPKGSTGNKAYTANWTNEYTIIYHSNNGADQITSQTVIFDQEVDLQENTFSNGNMIFKEWTTKSDGSGVKYIDKARIVNLAMNEDFKVHLYAQWEEPNRKKATFKKGIDVNKTMKQLSGTSNANENTLNSNIKSIKRATQQEYDSATASKSLVSTNDSNYPIYMWYDNGTIYYYSEADDLYLNVDSQKIFHSLTELTFIDLKDLNTSNVKNFNSAFENCKKIQELDLRQFNTSKLCTTQYMFNVCEELTSLNLSSFNTCQVNTMDHTFSSCKALTKLDITNFNTFNVKAMSKMFDDMYKLQSLDLSSFDTRNVETMVEMFETNESLKYLDLRNFNTSNVKSMQKMFNECTQLENVNLSGFSNEKVTDMSSMFAQCKSLKTVDLTNFKTGNVINMASVFNTCEQLTSVDLSSFDTSKVTDMNRMFAGCATLVELDVSSFNTSNVKNMEKMFSNMKNIETIYADDGFTTGSVTNGNQMFVYDTTRPGDDQPNAKLKGGEGTTYDKNHLGKDYARIDDAHNGNPGYFSRK